MDFAVKTYGLSKVYRLYGRRRDRLKEALNPFGRSYHSEFYALKDVSMEIRRGEAVGIIGFNGAGKSTLLQIISGVLTPTAGTIEVQGRVSALLELGAGFNPEFTGLENVEFQCAMMGYSAEATRAILPEIVEFADIGDFVHQPVKMYSSGMYVRLAFSVAINVDPEILIVDEALAVGDMRFQTKCLERIRRFREKGRTLIFVSHDAGAVKALCDKAYLLDRGLMIDGGPPDRVFNLYNGLSAERDRTAALEAAKSTDDLASRSGNHKVKIESVKILDNEGMPCDTFTSGDHAVIEVIAHAHVDVEDPTFGILIRDRFGHDIFGTNNHHLGTRVGKLGKGSEIKVAYRVPLTLGPANYNLTVAVHGGSTHIEENYDWINAAGVFRVIPDPSYTFAGYCRIRPEFHIEQMS